MELDRRNEAVGGRKRGSRDLIGELLDTLHDALRDATGGKLRQRHEEVMQRPARGHEPPAPKQGLARQGDIPGAVERQVPRQDRDPQQVLRRFVHRREPGYPHLGMEGAAVRRAHGMHARLEHRIQRTRATRNRDALFVDEGMHAIAGVPDRLIAAKADLPAAPPGLRRGVRAPTRAAPAALPDRACRWSARRSRGGNRSAGESARRRWCASPAGASGGNPPVQVDHELPDPKPAEVHPPDTDPRRPVHQTIPVRAAVPVRP